MHLYLTFQFVASIYIWKFTKRILGLKKNEQMKLLFVFIGVIISFMLTLTNGYCQSCGECLSLQLTPWNILYPLWINTLLFGGVIYQEYLDFTLMKKIKKIKWSNLKQLFYAPLLEEITFRSLMWHILKENYILYSSVLFSLAHAHIGIRVYRQTKSIGQTLINTCFIMSYTFIFGLYSSIVFQNTQSLLSVFLLHSYCNLMEVPKFQKVFQRPKRESVKLLLIYFLGIGLFFSQI